MAGQEPVSEGSIRRGQGRVAAAMLVPALLLIALFLVVPVGYAIWLSLTNKSLSGLQATNTHFIGLDNYRTLLSSGDFLRALARSTEFVILSAILGQFLLGLLAALLLTRTQVRAKGAFGAAILLPLVVPEVVASLAWANMFAPAGLGTLNRLLSTAGAGPVAWLQQFPMGAIVVVNIWRGIAFAMIMFQAAIEGIPTVLVEAAQMDGASARQVVRYITLPLIKGPVFLYLLLTTITTFSVFGLVYFLTQGGPDQKTELVSIFIYNRAFHFFEVGLGSAASVIMLAIVLVLGVTYVRISRVEI
jgi:multiple sugar transport system permease protein